jgi:hypothetical protein
MSRPFVILLGCSRKATQSGHGLVAASTLARRHARGGAGPSRPPRATRRSDPSATVPHGQVSRRARAHANARSEVVPGRVPEPTKPTQLRLFIGEATEIEPGCASPSSTKPSNRHPWAWLLQRVFAVDVMTCPRCRGAMKLVELANEREAIARVLATAGLGPRPPPRPRPPLAGQLELKFAA